MRREILSTAVAVALALATGSVDAAAGWPEIVLEPFLSGLASPVQIVPGTYSGRRLYVVQQGGAIRVAEDGVLLGRPYLDISDRVGTGGERGLLSLALAPSGFGRYCFVAYTDRAGSLVVSGFAERSDYVADPSSERIFLTIPHPNQANHNGGQLAFGPDGYLYIGTGDGGGAGDQPNNAQDITRLLGKVLRIGVRYPGPYSVPPTNPFVSTPGARPEIWAYGLRNPWRFSFDRRTGDLWMGDVGQNAWEEIDFQLSSSHGGENYGWHVMEGTHCYNPSSGCPAAGLVLPVAEYKHDVGCSVTGGFVYRGRRLEDLWGVYLYADYCSGRIWGLRRNTAGGWETAQLLKTDLSISGFGEDFEGELYVVDLQGAVYRVASAGGTNEVRTVPIVLDVLGAAGARFTTELVLANRGTSAAALSIVYTPAASLGATGAGTFTESLAAGVQVVIPDTFTWLRSKGLTIPEGPGQGGTLRISATGLSSAGAFFALARTTAPSGAGRAGTSYPALSPADLLDKPAWVFGLRQDAANRSNLALVNAGTTGEIVLRVTLHSGEFGEHRPAVLPDIPLGAGQWTQLNGVLARAGLTNGYAFVERTAGAAPFYAYAVDNDTATQDGSLIPPVEAGLKSTAQGIPVALENAEFSTELIVVNPGPDMLILSARGFSFDAPQIYVLPWQQLVIPSVRRFLSPGYSLFGVGPIAFETQSLQGGGPPAREFLLGARTVTPAPGGGVYGVSYTTYTGAWFVANSEPDLFDGWVHGLRQDDSSRSNLALFVPWPPLAGPSGSFQMTHVSVDVYDGDSGLFAGRLSLELNPTSSDWMQVGRVLERFGISNGYVHVIGDGPFSAYGVLNDGARPGMGTSDGSFIAMSR